MRYFFYTHSFALKVFRLLIVVHVFTTPEANSSKSHYFWRVFRVESTLLLDREVKRRNGQISTSDLVWPCATSLVQTTEQRPRSIPVWFEGNG